MKLTRRRFVQGTTAGAMLASAHVLAFVGRVARAAGGVAGVKTISRRESSVLRRLGAAFDEERIDL